MAATFLRILKPTETKTQVGKKEIFASTALCVRLFLGDDLDETPHVHNQDISIESMELIESESVNRICSRLLKTKYPADVINAS